MAQSNTTTFVRKTMRCFSANHAFQTYTFDTRLDITICKGRLLNRVKAVSSYFSLSYSHGGSYISVTFVESVQTG